MLKADKERIVEELTERLKTTPTLFVADYRGLSVTEIDELRTKVIEHGVRFTVVKNTLTKRAAEVAGAPVSSPSRIRHTPKPPPLRPHSRTMSR